MTAIKDLHVPIITDYLSGAEKDTLLFKTAIIRRHEFRPAENSKGSKYYSTQASLES